MAEGRKPFHWKVPGCRPHSLLPRSLHAPSRGALPAAGACQTWILPGSVLPATEDGLEAEKQIHRHTRQLAALCRAADSAVGLTRARKSRDPLKPPLPHCVPG
jgi:hypothetical protein